jgi:hypothetical protein
MNPETHARAECIKVLVGAQHAAPSFEEIRK